MGASLVYLDKPKKDIQFDEGENEHLRFVAASMQGWRVNMEDSHIAALDFGKDLNKSHALFGVFDGHGGREVAIYSEQHFGQLLKNNENYKGEKFDKALSESFLKIDEELSTEGGRDEIVQMKKRNPPEKAPLFKLLGDLANGGTGAGGQEQTPETMMLDSIGCTANVIFIDDMKKLYIANAGDSRCVLARGGKALALSLDHKPDNDIEKTRIEKAGSTIQEGRVDGNLNLSRSLGDLKYKQNKALKPEEQPITAFPDVKVVDISPEDDFIIMGCDGIWETKSNEEMVEYIYEKIKQKADLKLVIEDLLNTIISPDYTQTAGVGCDNMTCIIIQFKTSPLLK